MDKLKKVILIDLDGVLNTYTGSFDEKIIPPIKAGTKEFLETLSQNFVIKIFTTRNKLLTAKWLIENNIDKYVEEITDRKELAWLYIDDRCITFEGDFDQAISKINSFKPYYRK